MKTLTAIALLLISGTAQAQVADPMRPSGMSAPRATSAPRAAAVSSLKLEGILQSANVRVAIVNGQVVREGAQIAGAVILAILPDGIRYSRSGREQTLMLPNTAASVRVVQSLEAKKP
jgi:hypothetical protein